MVIAKIATSVSLIFTLVLGAYPYIKKRVSIS